MLLVGWSWQWASPTIATAAAGDAGADGPVFGISEPGAWRTDPVHASPDEIAGLVNDIGASSHEFWVYWDTVEHVAPVNGVHTYRFDVFDRMYEADLARGIKPLITVQGSPPWAWKDGVTYAWLSEHPPSPEHYGDWRAFLTELVRRYPEAIGIQIWNEPNLTWFWGLGDPADPTDPVAYAELLKQAYQAIKAADPSMPVIGGGLSNNRVTADGHIAMSEFANRMFAEGAAQYMDGLGIHPYPDTADLSGFHSSLEQVRSVMRSFGASKPLWITEVGKTTTGSNAVSEARQAKILVEIYSAVQQMPDVAAFYMHNLTEPTQDDANAEKGYGLVRGQGVGSAFSPKPAFTALQQEATSPPPPPVTEVDPVILSLSSQPAQRAAARRGISVVAQCQDQACTASAAGTVRIRRRDGTIATIGLRPAVRSIAANQPTPVKLGLRWRAVRRIKRALSAGRRVTARVHATVQGGAGEPSQVGGIRIIG